MPALSIRRITSASADAIVALLNPIIAAGTYTAITRPIDIEDQRAFITGLPARALYHGAFDERGVLLGIQDVLPDPDAPTQGHVSTFIALAAHRRGVGRALTTTTLARARDHGYQIIQAEIRADNPGALAFYAAQGFEVVGRAPGLVVTQAKL